jgi:hypothetical protein
MLSSVDTATPRAGEAAILAGASLRQACWHMRSTRPQPSASPSAQAAKTMRSVGGLAGEDLLARTAVGMAGGSRCTQTEFWRTPYAAFPPTGALAAVLQSHGVVGLQQTAIRSLLELLRGWDMTGSPTAGSRQAEGQAAELVVSADLVAPIKPKRRGTIRAALQCEGRGKLTGIVDNGRDTHP